MHTIPCSVGILTFNNEKTLKQCLDSVREFDEIIVCDGGSTDRTLEIAREYGCTIIEQDATFKNEDNTIADFSGIRNQTLKAASKQWFLYVDSDEYLSKEAVDEVRETIKIDDPKRRVFNMLRKFVMDGEVIECSSGYPNIQTRFFHLDVVTGFIKKVHERIDPKEGYEIFQLAHPTLVPTESDTALLWEKQRKYIAIEVQKHTGIGCARWFRWILWYNFKSILSYSFKYVRSLLLCRGKRVPFAHEMITVRYLWILTWKTFAGIRKEKNK